VRAGRCHVNFFAGEEVGTFEDDHRKAGLESDGAERADQALAIGLETRTAGVERRTAQLRRNGLL
jgi:hypothetical protein